MYHILTHSVFIILIFFCYFKYLSISKNDIFLIYIIGNFQLNIQISCIFGRATLDLFIIKFTNSRISISTHPLPGSTPSSSTQTERITKKKPNQLRKYIYLPLGVLNLHFKLIFFNIRNVFFSG